ncbi:MAG: 6,7-dimethyl-8-ribityllumazine synthase [Verrucomicrobia bacterium]|nr:6,7-dimethyl-8-ribityllumazine synthase [Verrucomicrobiota bacterium]MCF7707480.1 6,7-dimethyl-8-ribityllumazine synthase [Verrucomicrobiota bacterium]
MLREIKTTNERLDSAKFAIVASEYNAEFVGAMVEGATAELKRMGAGDIDVVRVPGAYEIPCAAGKVLALPKKYDAVICLGVVIRGETEHARLIGEAVTSELMRMQVEHLVPVVHEVLLLEDIEQARKRCLDPKHNRGREAAHTAARMAILITRLSQER